jgi:hypothetical protein
MGERLAQDQSASLKKLIPFLVFRGYTIDRKLSVVAARTTFGRDKGCDVVLDDDSIIPRWGAILRRGDGLYVQHEGGGPVPVEPGEGFRIGPYHVVRADFGTDLGRIWKTVEPGVAVQPDEKKQLYVPLFVLGDVDVGSQTQRLLMTEGDVPPRLQTYTAEKRLSEKAQDVCETISRAVNRAAADSQLTPDADPPLRALDGLAYPELIAVLEQLGLRRNEGVPELHTFFTRFLIADPVHAYRLHTLLRVKFAAEVRGSGGKAQFPALRINWPLYLGPEVLAKFAQLTEAVGKLVDEGVS